MIYERSSGVLTVPFLDSIQTCNSNGQHGNCLVGVIPQSLHSHFLLYVSRTVLPSSTSEILLLPLSWVNTSSGLVTRFPRLDRNGLCYSAEIPKNQTSESREPIYGGIATALVPAHFLSISSIQGDLSNASVSTLTTPLIQFWWQDVWNLSIFIPIWYLSEASWVGRDFTSFQYQNFC